MALDDRQHVEAVAIMRRLHECVENHIPDGDALSAADIWLRENHPEPSVCMAALRAASSREGNA